MSTGFIYDPRYQQHDTGPDHPERPERLAAIVQHLQKNDLWEKLHHLHVTPADLQWIESVHPRAHIEHIETAYRNGIRYLDADTVISRESYEIALLAVGGVLAACDAVMSGVCSNAFCAVRPPGHHAERDQAMGFCLFNNIAVAARYMQQHGAKKVCILDWDVHHGNGTQHIFEEDPTVLYISLHQHPLYPGTGRSSERGIGVGEGFTLNLPLPPGSDDDDYKIAFTTAIERINEFTPDFILISAGFDAHRDDPLANMRVTEDGFRWMSRQMLDVAAKHCEGKMVAVLEGGYNLAALAASVGVCLEEMTTASFHK